MKEPIIPGGFVLLPRVIFESEIFHKAPLYLKVWIYLLQRAQHGDYKLLKRGQLRTSIPEIREACSWYVGYRKESPSKGQILNILNWLRRLDDKDCEEKNDITTIEITKATHGMLISLVNYDFYQDANNYEGYYDDMAEEETAVTCEASKQHNINKNEKNEKNETNIITENIFSEDSIEITLSKELYCLIKRNNPNMRMPNFQVWARSIHLMLSEDERTAEDIRELINFSQESNFWRGVIISTAKLRDKYDMLYVQSKQRAQESEQEMAYWINAES